jgi:solute carrier family 12 sodium/potassium/chloride transporter 2
VVGQAGILLAILILILSYVVTTITTLSLSAIVTNGQVRGGGIYFLIARALGPQWGVTIGFLFFWAQAMAASMYAVGFSEVLVDLVSNYGTVPYFTTSKIDDIRVISVLTIIVLLGIGLMGISYFAKTQSTLFVIMVVAIIAVIIGSAFPAFPSQKDNTDKGFVGYGPARNMLPEFSFDPTRPGVEYNFFTVFAVFFPAATGIMAGANIAGDLAKPSEAIPKGTLLAVLVTFLCYLLLIFVVGLACLRCTDSGLGHCPDTTPAGQQWAYQALANNTIPMGGLLYNKIIMATMVPVHPFYFFGVFASSLSSCLSSLVSAPRILQSVAKDKIFPWAWLRFMAVGSGSGDEPMRALVFTFFITTAVALIGNLDAIATIITNVFLASYALVNYAAFEADRTKTAGWRPQFKKFNQWISLIGSALCIFVMFLIDWFTALLTFILCFVIYQIVGLIDVPVNWGAADDAFKYVRALSNLVRLAAVKAEHVKTYRLQLLVLAGPAGERPGLVKFASMVRVNAAAAAAETDGECGAVPRDAGSAGGGRRGGVPPPLRLA